MSTPRGGFLETIIIEIIKQKKKKKIHKKLSINNILKKKLFTRKIYDRKAVILRLKMRRDSFNLKWGKCLAQGNSSVIKNISVPSWF